MARDTINWKMETKNCENCSISVTSPLWRKQRFCSYSCARIKAGTKGKKIEAITGSNHYLWKEDRTLIKGTHERNNPEYKQWRKSVWERDRFTCRITDNNCDGRIEAHHILGWSAHPELRYKTNNGITLCQAHHPKKRAEEKRLIPTFIELVSVSKK